MALDHRRWLAGDVMTLADFAAAAYLSSLDYISDVDWNRSETVKDWYAKIKSRPAFRSILADAVPGFSTALALCRPRFLDRPPRKTFLAVASRYVSGSCRFGVGNMTLKKADIVARAIDEGFSLARVTRPDAVPEVPKRLSAFGCWLSRADGLVGRTDTVAW